MRMPRTVAVLLLTGLASCGPSSCEGVRSPVDATIELRIRQIYDAGEWLRRVPVELAMSLYARTKLEAFLDELVLPEDVDARLRARLRSDDFIDELVPFLLFVREMYTPPTGDAAETFDDHLRRHFSPGERIAGIEHSMFRWVGARSEGGGLPTLDPDMVRGLLRFYDALYLEGRMSAGHLDERLACESRDDLESLEAATRVASPAIRGLLEALQGSMEPESEMVGAIDSVLQDDARLDAATSALIRFVDQAVCRNYRFFAARAFRARQLEAWMQTELAAAGGGALWDFLEHAQTQRRYGGVIVVDGLQGRLLEALAEGDRNAAFVRAIVEEQSQAGGDAPRARSLRASPPQQTEFLAAFAAEGFRHEHYLPFFQRLRADAKTRWVPIGVSTTPTISVRNIPIALTGAAVSGAQGTGLPNFHFVERSFEREGETRGRAYYFYGSDAVDLGPLAEAAGMRTLFDRLPHLGSLSCTAQYDEAAHFGVDALLNLGLGEKLRDFGERLCAAELELRSRNERKLQQLRTKLQGERGGLGSDVPWWRFWSRFGAQRRTELASHLISEIAELEQRTLPELFVAYNPWPDHFAHFEGPFADEILSPSGELNRLDYWLARFERAYADAGVAPRTLFGIAGDHGLVPVYHLLSPEVEVFDALREEGVDLRVEKISSDEGEGPKLTNPFDPPSMKGIDVVVASTAGGNYMLDLFVDQDAGFERQPLQRELRAVQPLASPDAEPVDLVEELATRLADSLDYLVVREEPCTPAGGAVRLVGQRDGVRAEAVIRRDGDRIHLALEGADLLGTNRLSPYETFSEAQRREHAERRARCLDVDALRPGEWCRSDEWRYITSFTTRPDSVVQLSHLYDSERAGTINLFPRAGVGYNSVVPGRHAGESFHEKNALVVLFGGALTPRSGSTPLRSALNGSVPMAIYEYLADERPARGEAGFGYAPFPEDWLAR
jgi:hypothetical protein